MIHVILWFVNTATLYSLHSTPTYTYVFFTFEVKDHSTQFCFCRITKHFTHSLSLLPWPVVLHKSYFYSSSTFKELLSRISFKWMRWQDTNTEPSSEGVSDQENKIWHRFGLKLYFIFFYRLKISLIVVPHTECPIDLIQ